MVFFFVFSGDPFSMKSNGDAVSILYRYSWSKKMNSEFSAYATMKFTFVFFSEMSIGWTAKKFVQTSYSPQI